MSEDMGPAPGAAGARSDDSAPDDGSPPNALKLEALPIVAPTDLRVADATSLGASLAMGLIPFARLVECRADNKLELVVMDVEVELAQRAVHDIRALERIGVLFPEVFVQRGPEVLALREDFPIVPHLHLTPWERPRSLCLYDVPFREVRPQLTPARFVARIREWLRLTARGELHAEDQPLEPILVDGSFWIILPRAIREAAEAEADEQTVVTDVALSLSSRPRHRGLEVFATSAPQEGAQTDHKAAARAAIVRVRPRTHGLLTRAPATLADLHTFLADGGDDLLGALRAALWSSDRSPQKLRALFLLVVLAPKRRRNDAPVETVDVWAFAALGHTLGSFGEAIGAWTLINGVPGRLVGSTGDLDGRSVRLRLGYPIFEVGRDDLARFNDRDEPDERRIVAVGGGALGSQVMLNAARGAFGRWTVIDNDLLLPHNVARHALSQDAVGFHKAVTLPPTANGLLSDREAIHAGVVADVLSPGDAAASMDHALGEAELIVDLSASVTVARHLATDVTASARRVSLFLNPTGTALVMIAEDTARQSLLDALEMQLYRAVATQPALDGLWSAPEGVIRYGRTCRDVSAQLPQSLVAIHAGLATRALERIATHADAGVTVWRIDPDTGAVNVVAIPVFASRVCSLAGWRLVTDVGLLARLHELRDERLPNETGGVLLGHYDFGRRILYVVDTIPSPRDSREYPTAYIRGTDGLEDAAKRFTAATDNQVHYVGEWHSHPRGSPCLPSHDDGVLFAWLDAELVKDGLPPFLLIVGDDSAVPYLGALPAELTYPAILRVDER